MDDSWSYTQAMALRAAAKVIFALAFLWAVVQYVRGFVEGVLEARERHFQVPVQPARPKPERMRAPRHRPAQPSVPIQYTVEMEDDNEVMLNGLSIGHVDASPWQFCSYDESFGNGPARATKQEAWEDAADYAESLAKLYTRGA